MISIISTLFLLLSFLPGSLKAQRPVRFDVDSICKKALELPLEKGIALITGSFEKCRDTEQESQCLLKLNFTAGYLFQKRSVQSLDNQHAALERSRVFYQRAYEIEPADISVLNNLFLVNQSLGNTRVAIDILDQAIEADQKNRAKYLINQGDIYFEMQDYMKAIELYKKAFFADPENEELGWKIIYSFNRITDQQEASNGLITFSNELFGMGLDDLARNGFVRAVFISSSINDNAQAEQACIKWAETLSRKNIVTADFIDELPDLKTWPSGCNQQIQLLLSNSFESTDQLRWWTVNDYRSHIVASLLLKMESAALVSNDIKNAVRMLETGLKIAPEFYAYNHPELKKYYPVKMDIAIELSRLYNRYPEMDPDKTKYDELIRVLFDEKMMHYLEQDLESIQRSHTILGLIFADREVWTSGWFAGNAIFQLERAIKFQEKLEAEHPEKFKPIPSIYQLLAKGYEKTNRPKEERQCLVNAAAGYLDLDNLSMADSLIKKVNHARFNDIESNMKLEELALITDMRLNIRNEKYNFKSADMKTLERDITESELFMLTENKNDPSFMNRQKFKILADLGSKSSQLNPAYKYPFFEIKALDYIDQEKALGNYQDINRLNHIETKFIMNLDPETEIKVNQNINVIETGGQYKTWSVNSGDQQTQIQADNDLLVAGRLYENLAKENRDHEVEGLNKIQIRKGDIFIPDDVKERQVIDESQVRKVKGVNKVQIMNQVREH